MDSTIEPQTVGMHAPASPDAEWARDAEADHLESGSDLVEAAEEAIESLHAADPADAAEPAVAIADMLSRALEAEER
ncbi:MAG: hypothetical protein OEX04_09245 [Acidimicrobiia bacterium]|nr:hypothetical protein [Acidimicrobiia bacterium]MDH4307650.1 hypothetical protein [Acidimicrobiia bacterium]MDH5294256.1 hypothetical protein [Acidimicrobiia bacterium]